MAATFVLGLAEGFSLDRFCFLFFFNDFSVGLSVLAADAAGLLAFSVASWAEKAERVVFGLVTQRAKPCFLYCQCHWIVETSEVGVCAPVLPR